MRISSLMIVVPVVAAVIFGAYILGHAVDKPSQQLDKVISEPGRAASATAAANLSTAVSAAASYRFDHGSYAGMTTKDLRDYDKGLAPTVSVKQASGDAYCMESKVADATVSIRGPSGTFVTRSC
jgi:hypothetical protein